MGRFKIGDVVRINRPDCDMGYNKQIGKITSAFMTSDKGYLVTNTSDKGYLVNTGNYTWMLFESELSDVQDGEAVEWILKNT